MTCGDNMKYDKYCGVCELNCGGEQVDPMCKVNDDTYCLVDCMCDKGYRRHGDKCVTLDHCKKLTACKVTGRRTLLPVSK